MNIFDDDDAFVGTPKSNYFSIAKNANQNIVEMEIERMLRRLAVAERMLEQNSLEDSYEKEILATMIDKDIDDRLNSLFIELVGNIVTQCE